MSRNFTTIVLAIYFSFSVAMAESQSLPIYSVPQTIGGMGRTIAQTKILSAIPMKTISATSPIDLN